MSEKVDYSQFQYKKDNDKKKRSQESKIEKFGSPDNITYTSPQPYSKKEIRSRRREIIAVLAVVMCFCLTLYLADYFSNGYLLADFDKDATVSGGEYDYYAVQTGMYTDRKTAELYAENIRKRGGAGYVLYDGVYRVVASVYTKAVQARTVAERMGEAGVDATVFSFSLQPVSDSSLSATDRNTLVTVSEYTTYCYETLYDLSIQIDTGTLTDSELQAKLTALKSFLEQNKAKVDKIEFSTPAYSLSSAISASIQIIKDVPESPTSGDIRYAYIAILAMRI